MAEEKQYYMRVKREIITVAKEVHEADEELRRQLRTQKDSDKDHGLLHFDSFDTNERLGVDILVDPLAESIEDRALSRVMSEKLHRAIAKLTPEEQEIITAIYFEGKTERQTAEQIRIPQTTVNYRKRKILKKLKKFLEK